MGLRDCCARNLRTASAPTVSPMVTVVTDRVVVEVVDFDGLLLWSFEEEAAVTREGMIVFWTEKYL